MGEGILQESQMHVKGDQALSTAQLPLQAICMRASWSCALSSYTRKGIAS